MGLESRWRPPPRLEGLGPDVWSSEGVKVLGTPVGSPTFVSRVLAERVEREKQLLDAALANVKDGQCAWQLLVQCAVPRANHTLRTVPPSGSAEYAHLHDNRMWEAAGHVIGGFPVVTGDAVPSPWERASLPMRLGGLGI